MRAVTMALALAGSFLLYGTALAQFSQEPSGRPLILEGPYNASHYRPEDHLTRRASAEKQRTPPGTFELQSRTRETFVLAQSHKEKGDMAAACRSIRKAIALDRRYIARKRAIDPDIPVTDEDFYSSLEAEYCVSARG
ncbi:hypothetical protein [Asticcacaulis excentricus]|uniref:Secreted protein n=1 Tax=Asticcacaulis excentricus (strain ATCC 15261 / DSM 4724 / KCTC 12464 / NCIMB 9791 / VKM B-1370 / CB 48) TaxID=573065 RepID=E8RKH8_ASTEC|nr:hypothetical protein [Asticcacaulis excentricus]ADU12458.1 hypothetical protein Astex_0773 [Asticcacaulis excentricus CB 48]